MSVGSKVGSALLSAVAAFTLVTGAGCGTDAKGVDECRNIEEARCSAAKNCGIISDVAQCQTFYRDQCLHGLAVTPPGSARIKDCVNTIRAAGVCALQGPDTLLGDCPAGLPSTGTSAETTCQIVTNPETTSECSFLMPDAVASGGAGGGSGTGGSSNGGAANTVDAADADGTAGAAN